MRGARVQKHDSLLSFIPAEQCQISCTSSMSRPSSLQPCIQEDFLTFVCACHDITTHYHILLTTTSGNTCSKSHPFAQVKLIVIDSIAFHFRQDFQDMAQRTRVLAEMAQKLMHLAEEKDLAVSFCMHLSLFPVHTIYVCQI